MGWGWLAHRSGRCQKVFVCSVLGIQLKPRTNTSLMYLPGIVNLGEAFSIYEQTRFYLEFEKHGEHFRSNALHFSRVLKLLQSLSCRVARRGSSCISKCGLHLDSKESKVLPLQTRFKRVSNERHFVKQAGIWLTNQQNLTWTYSHLNPRWKLNLSQYWIKVG